MTLKPGTTFWSIQGDFICRHHIVPRVQLQVTRGTAVNNVYADLLVCTCLALLNDFCLRDTLSSVLQTADVSRGMLPCQSEFCTSLLACSCFPEETGFTVIT